MTPDRLRMLEQYYQEDPNDPFNIYGLALEYLKHDLAKSRVLFDRLLTEHPAYVATYYHAGKLYEQLGEGSRAVTIFRNGIEVSTRAGELKAARELRAALDELEFDG